MTYGTTVNFTAKLRGKDGAANHVIASLVAFPIIGVYARSTFFFNSYFFISQNRK